MKTHRGRTGSYLFLKKIIIFFGDSNLFATFAVESMHQELSYWTHQPSIADNHGGKRMRKCLT